MNPLLLFLTSGQIPHAILLTGPRTCDLGQLATQFASQLVGGHPHPDIHEYFPEGKTGMHPILQMRQLTQEVGLVPYQAERHCFLVHEAERMLPTSSNALLKTFEEPSPRTVLLLLSHYPQRLLPTILSRCYYVDATAAALSADRLDKPKACPPLVDVLAGRQPLSSLTDEGTFESVAETVLLWYRDRLLLDIPGGEPYMTYREAALTRYPLLPLSQVEGVVAQIQKGYERGMAWTASLEMLALCLGWKG